MRDAGRNDAGEVSHSYAQREGWRLRNMSLKLPQSGEIERVSNEQDKRTYACIHL
jgi:hypothetical protein